MSAHAVSSDARLRPFSCRFAAAHEKPALLADRQVLLLIEFDDRVAVEDPDPRCIRVGLRQLGASPIVEVWESELSVETGTVGKVAYSMNDEVLIGHVAVDDRDFANLEAAAQQAYESFLPVATELGFPHYLRMWNYIPDINGPDINGPDINGPDITAPDISDADVERHARGIERYKAFCAGRHSAFADFSMALPRLPAASAVGSPSGRLLVYFIAARDPGRQVENPRQVSAFHYPRRYGPKSPAFSRAMVKDWGSVKHLYVSGTASIVGHASRHHQQAAAQTIESLRNMSALLRNADSAHDVGVRSLHELSQIKVYVRHAEDVGAVRECIEREVSDPHRVLYLAGDLCRADLLVELEGWYIG